MQFTNTSDATLQTDTNQHNAGGELHETLLNNEPYQHTRPHPMGAAAGPTSVARPRRGARRAWPDNESARHLTQHRRRRRCGGRRRARRARAGLEIDHSEPQARVWRSRGRAAAHRHTQRPGPTKQATRRQGLAGLREDTPSQSSAHPAPPVWRAPEGPEGTGGLRGAAPNKVRSPSLAGGRALRRPEHPWGHKQHEAARPHRGRAAHASGR